jgi:NadR type nicotinamide-nucleotide adenylyltransferase
MNIGIMFGCFIPLHLGHTKLIQMALDQNDKIIIGVCGYEDDRGKNFLNFNERYNLILDKFKDNKNVKVVKIDDKKLGLDGTFTLNNWVLWSNELFTNANINPDDKSINFNWYTGEKSYIEKLKNLFPTHNFNLINRNEINISGSQIRTDFKNYQKYIDKDFYKYLECKFKEVIYER